MSAAPQQQQQWSSEQQRQFDDLVDAGIRKSEQWVSSVRAAFCVAVLVRRASYGGFWDGEKIPATAFMMTPFILATLAFSLWLAVRTRRVQPLPRALSFASVFVDAFVCFLALASNAIIVHPSYRGVAAHPDVIALMLAIAAAGFRLSPAVTAFGAALNTLSFGALLVVDKVLVPEQIEPKAGGIFLVSLSVASAALIAVAVARRAHATALDAARAAVAAERTRAGLDVILEEHHDLRSTLGAALMNAELMQRELRERGALADDGKKHIADLTNSLVNAQRTMRELRARALGEAAGLDVAVDVDVVAVLNRAIAFVQRRHPSTPIAIEAAPPTATQPALARVAGGAASLERIVMNVLLNACEGDGVSGARHVRVRVFPAPKTTTAPAVAIVIEDDGPGLAARPSQGSSKPDGTGLGLLIVASLVTASGGTVVVEGVPAGGTRVHVELPASA